MYNTSLMSKMLFMTLIIITLIGFSAEKAMLFAGTASDLHNVMPELRIASREVIIDEKEIYLTEPMLINANKEPAILLQDVLSIWALQIKSTGNREMLLYNDKLSIKLSAEHCYFDPSRLDWGNLSAATPIYIILPYLADELSYQWQLDPADQKLTLLSAKFLEEKKKIVSDVHPAVKQIKDLPLWGSLSSTALALELWPDAEIIAGFYTTLLDKSANRTTNIKLACQQIDGTVLAAGEVFSFNNIVGLRSQEKGYRQAKIFVGDQISYGIGGGICQLSSTLYNCALIAKLPIIERHHHSLAVSYAPDNQDATVAWGVLDFRFKNNDDSDLTIRCKVYDQYVVVAFMK